MGAATVLASASASHLPPGTSKWNKIEHRLFSHISMNWRGKPLIDHETIVSLIGATTTTEGLRVRAELDRACYPKGITTFIPSGTIPSVHRRERSDYWSMSHNLACSERLLHVERCELIAPATALRALALG